jgi:hypothetical protein
MAVFNWPTSIKVGPVDYAVEFDVQLTIVRSGKIFTYGLPGARWTCSVRFENDLEKRRRPALEAMLVNLEGGAHRLSFGHWGRPIPNGTLRGSPTLGSLISPGATSLTIVNANGSLRAGDIIGLPGQFVMVMADVNPTLTNLNNVPVKPAFRAAHNSGTAVVWNRPTTLWIPDSNIAGPFPYEQARSRPGFSVRFIEAWV